MMKSKVACALSLLVAVLGAGCDDAKKSKSDADGGTEGGDGSVASPASLAEVRKALAPLAAGQCAWLFSCCDADELAGDIGPAVKDAATCADLLLDRVSRGVDYFYFENLQLGLAPGLSQLDRLGYEIDRGRITVDEAAVKACATQLEKAECRPEAGAFCTARDLPAPGADPCNVRKLLVGKQKAGQPCESYVGDIDCAPGLRCVGGSYQGVCVAAASEGKGCLDTDECAQGLRCDPAQGKCTKGLAQGEKCSFADPARPVPGTEKTVCAQGLVCDALALKCTDARCAAGAGCSDDSNCPQGTQCVRGICGALAKSGEPCYANDDCENNRCDYDTLLGAQRCAVERKDGAACTNHTDCESGYCEAAEISTCKPRLTVGEACAQAAQCTLGTCDFNLEQPVCITLGVEGAECMSVNDCALYDGFECRGDSCHRAPFALGVMCSYNEECASKACANGLCVMPGEEGDACGAGSDLPPCAKGAYCQIEDEALGKGTCKEKLGFGAPCMFDYQCSGSCSPLNGMLRCTGNNRENPACTGTK